VDSSLDEEATWLKASSRVLLALYLLVLLWLVLFKLSYDVSSVLASYQTRSLNLIPFVTLGQTGLSETVSNFVTFVPFGLLLSLNFKKASLWRLLVVVLAFSVTVETLQFVLAIGTTDATDVVTNTLGGLAGIVLYRLGQKVVPEGTLDRVITVVGIALFGAFLLLRLLVFKVRY
jgi:glycopeptide antibiotics resistance protein